jgi:hypothetical protein
LHKIGAGVNSLAWGFFATSSDLSSGVSLQNRCLFAAAITK